MLRILVQTFCIDTSVCWYPSLHLSVCYGQWFAVVDLDSDTPAIPTGFLRLSVIINVQDALGAALDNVPEVSLDPGP
eukprot:533073-Rhodomonas_salina.1